MPDTARTVVITGASSGFGAAAVRAFADRGNRVWGTMRDADGRNSAKKADLEAYAPGIAIAEMDVTSDASVADGFAAILAEGPIDILINNAGIMYIGMLDLACDFVDLAIAAHPNFRLFAERNKPAIDQHRQVLKKFGRYPQRNAEFDRETTAAEKAWLDDKENLPIWAGGRASFSKKIDS